MDWFTYIVYGLVAIILFASIGIIMIRIFFKLLIDSWQKQQYDWSRNDKVFSEMKGDKLRDL